MAGDETPAGGVVESVRRLWGTGLATLQNRVELFAVEFEEQKVRLVRVVLLAGAAVFVANTAILVVTATIVLIVGESARVPVLIGLSVVYVVAAIVAGLLLRKELRSAPPAFDGTLSELKKDREWLKPK